jgi:hypothetical protein
MSLYDKSSLLQVPSLYKDGTLVSTIPEDRSGDFTVSRGSNLAATRIGPDGYIKKGYENLLLQSNTFDTTWTPINSSIPISGQEGYDGANDAWLLQNDNNSGFINQDISNSGVSVFSVYAKAGNVNFIRVRADYSSIATTYFDLENGTIGDEFNVIESKITSVGNGWYRCSIIYDGTTTRVRLYPAVNATTTGVAGDNIYIQDAQLNQGLVAYPYLETTDAPVQGGLLENTPRLDWSNGVPSVLVEPQRTNLLRNSEALNISPNVVESVSYSYNEIASPSGFINAPKFSETTEGTAYRHGFYHYVVIPNGAITASIFTKQIDRRYVSLQSNATGSNQYSYVDLQDGSVVSEGTGWTLSTEDYGNGWWRIIATAMGIQSSPYFIWGMSINGTSNTYSGDGSEFTFWGAQLEEGSYPSSYIPTYGTTQTRSSEVISDNFNIPTTATIYNSFYSDVAETVFVFDQVFNVVEGLNKVAIAFSPTAVKISVGGSIVANATGTYDTTSLTNIQLGSNNGTDYSNAPISGFYVFPEFLTDEELNSLTD